MVHANPYGLTRSRVDRASGTLPERHVATDSDDLESARGITYGVLVGAAIWAVVLLLLLW